MLVFHANDRSSKVVFVIIFFGFFFHLGVDGQEEFYGSESRLSYRAEDPFSRDRKTDLDPLDLYIEPTISYSREDVDELVIINGIPVLREVENETYRASFTFRIGLWESLELFTTVPFVYGKTTTLDILNIENNGQFARLVEDDVEEKFDLGDVELGLKYTFLEEDREEDIPQIIGSFLFKSRTGTDPFGLDDNDVATGDGRMRFSLNVTAVKSFDPVAIFGGIGFSFREHRKGVSGNDSFQYFLGLGYALHRKISLGFQLQGDISSSLELDGNDIPGTSQHSVVMQIGANIRVYEYLRIEPFVAFGLTDDAPDVILGVRIPIALKVDPTMAVNGIQKVGNWFYSLVN